MLKRLLFPVKPDGTATSAILLIARIVFGILLMNHGIQKWTNVKLLKLYLAIENTLYLCIKDKINNEKSYRLYSCFY